MKSGAVWAAGLLLALSSAEAAAESRLCTAITSLPYVVTAPGKYCLTGDLEYAGSTGAAIHIAAHHVTLDLNGFRISGQAAGAGTFAYGVYAASRREITVKNGAIVGFLYGILLDDDHDTEYTTGGTHLVERIRAWRNTFRGIRVEGRGSVVRDNIIQETGGTSILGDGAFAMGIEVFGPGVALLGNVVQDTFAQPLGEAVGISLSDAVVGAMVDQNHIVNEKLPASGSSWGIWIGGGSQALVTANRIIRMNNGIAVSSDAGGAYRDNLTIGCPLPVNSRSPSFVDAGNNN